MPKGYPGSKAPHGTTTRYVAHGCRCDECKTAAREYARALYGYRPADEYRASILPPHGTESRYKRCRCMFCREAARVARAGRRARARDAAQA